MYPDDLTLRGRLAASHTWFASYSRGLGSVQDAFEHYRRAYDIREALFTLQPEVTQRALDLIGSKTNLAVGYMLFDTPERDKIARRLLEEAAASLDGLRDSGELTGRSGIHDSWMATIHENLTLLAERGQRGSAPGVASWDPRDLRASTPEEP
jgi:hypothetical protein